MRGSEDNRQFKGEEGTIVSLVPWNIYTKFMILEKAAYSIQETGLSGVTQNRPLLPFISPPADQGFPVPQGSATRLPLGEGGRK